MKSTPSGLRRARILLLLLPVLSALVALGLPVPAAQAQSSSGSSLGSSGPGSGGGNPGGNDPLGEHEYRDAQGAVYSVNPRAQVAEDQVVDVLFPTGQADIGRVRTVSTGFLESTGIEEGTVLSILPSDAFPEGTLVKIDSVEPSGPGHALVTMPATLDDLIMETTGEVSFRGIPLEEGEPFTYHNSASGTVTIPYSLDLAEVLERVDAGKKGATDTKPGETASDPTVELSGDIEFGMELGYDRPNFLRKGDVSLDADASVTGTLSLQSDDTYEVAAGIDELLGKKLASLKTERIFVFQVGPVPVVGEGSVQPTVDIKGGLGSVPTYSPTFEAGATAGLKYIGEENTVRPTAEHSLAFNDFQFENPLAPDRGFSFQLEVAAGVEIEIEFYGLVGAGTGVKIPVGVEVGSDICEAYVKFEGPTGYVFAQPFVDSHRVEARFTPEFDLLKEDLGCTRAEDEDPEDTTPGYDTRPVSAAVRSGILNMAMPAVCGQQAGRLVNGELPDRYINDPGGFLTVLTDRSATRLEDRVQAVWIDADEDGDDEIALLAQCYRGGVSWPQSIFLLDSDLNLISAGPHNTGLQLPSGYDNARSGFTTFEVEDNALVLEYPTYAPGDAACCGSLTATGTMKIRGDHLVPVSPIVTRPRN